MLHLPSYNAGLAAGTVAKALGQAAPESWDAVPGLDEIVSVRAKDRFFFPLSFAEGYWAAFQYPDRQFSALPSDPDMKRKKETAATS
jgi:hypothetical protein